MRKVLVKICGFMCCMAVFMAQSSLNNICIWKAYQPKVPSALLNGKGSN